MEITKEEYNCLFLTRRVLNSVLEWYVLHKGELFENWEFAEKKMPLKKMEPLE
ncbi:MAG: hypothetical protein GY777_00945 [Candidatus Brocadiaceae bacterium]|nr:hypothetical protein [Candidatus Brocadiaceae bacterium]